MLRHIYFGLCTTIFLNFPLALADDIELPQGDSIGVELYERLQVAHGFAMNQKAQEELFLSLPLSEPQQEELIAVANTTAIISTSASRHRRKSTFSLNARLERRQDEGADPECMAVHTEAGQDLCKGAENTPGFVECIPPCTFDRDWFINNAAYPPGNTVECVFYTSGFSAVAQDFVNNHNSQNPAVRKTTIWHIWGTGDYMRYASRKKDNSMRCIIQEDVPLQGRNEIRQRYFEGMSQTMAYMCGHEQGGIKAQVMDREMCHGCSGRVFMDSIWGQVEFPMLRQETGWKGRRVDAIEAIGNYTSRHTRIRWPWWNRANPNFWPLEMPGGFPPLPNLRRAEGDDPEPFVPSDLPPIPPVLWDTSLFDVGGPLYVDW